MHNAEGFSDFISKFVPFVGQRAAGMSRTIHGTSQGQNRHVCRLPQSFWDPSGDLDRKGEAIAWQVLTWLQDKGPLEGKSGRRVVFHEVTAESVRERTHPCGG